MLKQKYTSEEKWYLLFIAYYFAASMIMDTMYYPLLNEKVYVWSIHAGLLLLFGLRFIWFRSYSGKEIAGFLLAGAIAFAAFWKSGQGIILDVFLLIVLGKNMPQSSVLKLYLIIKPIVFLAAFVGGLTGIIPNLVFENYRWGLDANAFGYPYYADASANILFWVIAYISWKNDRLKIRDGIGILVLSVLVFLLFTTRTDCILLAVIGLGVMIFSSVRTRRWMEYKVWKYGSGILLLFLSFGSLAATYWYRDFETVLSSINRILSHRFERGYEVLEKYPFSFWGRDIAFQGYGGMTYEETLALWENGETLYLFADNSYLNIWLRYGVPVLLFVCAVMLISYYRSWNNKNLIMCTAIALVMIDSVIVHHLMEPQYNFFLIIFWNKAMCEREKETERVYRKDTDSSCGCI